MHVFDLKLRSEFPNQNWSQCFPDRETQAIIFRDHTQEEAKEMANKNGVKKAVFVMCYDDCPEEALWVYENAQRVELFIGIVAGLDLTQHEKLKATIDKFSKLSNPKFVGVRHHLRFTGDILFSDNFQKGLSILQESQIPFDFNDVILEHVVTIAQRFPKLKMVIDHLGKPDIPNDFEAWKKTITEIAQYPNVYMKLSGLVVQTKEPWKRELFQPYIDHCIREFGAKRYAFHKFFRLQFQHF